MTPEKILEKIKKYIGHDINSIELEKEIYNYFYYKPPFEDQFSDISEITIIIDKNEIIKKILYKNLIFD